jgi:hypothetical protein
MIPSEASDLGPGHWRCHRCGHSYFLRRCSVCRRVSNVGGAQEWHQLWECGWCKESNPGFTRVGDPAAATVADLAADVAAHRLALIPAQRAEPPVPAEAVPASRNPGRRSTGAGFDVFSPSPQPAGPWQPRPGQAAVAPAAVPRSGRAVRLAAITVLAIAIIAVTAVLAARALAVGPGSAGAAGHLDQLTGAGPASRAILVTAGPVTAVDLQGVPGQLTITGTSGRQVTLAGQLHWTGSTPSMVTRLDRAAHVLHLTYRCAPASPCTEHYRLAVPGSTATVLRQSSGQLVVSGLAGPLQITAGRVDVTATGLRSPVLTAAISTGHLTARFALPPRQVSIALTSAQATLWLPGRARYRVSQQVSSGYIKIAIPHTAAAARTVTARIASGELELLPS